MCFAGRVGLSSDFASIKLKTSFTTKVSSTTKAQISALESNIFGIIRITDLLVFKSVFKQIYFSNVW